MCRPQLLYQKVLGLRLCALMGLFDESLLCCFSLGNFISTAEKIRLPDDCTIGYIIEALLEVTLTHTYLFHSHLENLQKLPTDTVLEQVSVANRAGTNSLWSLHCAVFSLTQSKSCLVFPMTAGLSSPLQTLFKFCHLTSEYCTLKTG